MKVEKSSTVSAENTNAEARYEELNRAVAEGFSGQIRRRKSSLWYQVAMFATALMVVLLPLVYVGLAGVLAWGIFAYADFGFGALMGGGGGSMLIRIVLYLCPIVAGLIILLFMVKPLVAPRAQGHSKVRLRQKDEPVLFAFIHRVAKEVGAPLPKRVDVDVQVNASASFRSGWFSLFSNDLVLTIGLPLAASLSVRQFGGVLAHEFGHFSQSIGMRLTFVIRNINAWFHRVVFERDRWDMWLEEMRRNDTWIISLIFNVAALAVWCSRKLLHGLMIISHAVSCYTLRQMEYDADYYEAHMAGSQNFGQTCDQLRRLNLACRRGYSELEQSWNQRRLADNLAEYIHQRSLHIPGEVMDSVANQLQEEKTGIFDTHPTDRKRSERALQYGTEGILTMEGSARTLFRDFDELARQATRHHYSIDLSLPIEPQHLVPVEEMAALGTRQQQAKESAEKFFGYAPRNSIPLYPPGWAWRPPEYLEEGVRELLELRQLAHKAALKMNGLWPEHDRLFQKRTQLNEMRSLAEAGFALQPGLMGLKDVSLGNLQKAVAEVGAELLEIREVMLKTQAAVGDRLAGALRLIWTPEVQDGIGDGAKLAARTHDHMRCLQALRDTLEPVDELFLMLRRSVVLLDNLNVAPEPTKAVSQLKSQAPVLVQRLNMCLAGLPEEMEYPFEHSAGEMKCKAYLLAHDVKEHPEAGELSLVLYNLGRVQQFFDRLFELQYRLLGELILAAVQVEEVTLPDEEAFDADMAGPGNLVVRKGQELLQPEPAAAGTPAPMHAAVKDVEVSSPPLPQHVTALSGTASPRAGVIVPLVHKELPAEVPPPTAPLQPAPVSGRPSLNLNQLAARQTARIPTLQELGLEGARTDLPTAPPVDATTQLPGPGDAAPPEAAAVTPPPLPREPLRMGGQPNPESLQRPPTARIPVAALHKPKISANVAAFSNREAIRGNGVHSPAPLDPEDASPPAPTPAPTVTPAPAVVAEASQPEAAPVSAPIPPAVEAQAPRPAPAATVPEPDVEPPATRLKPFEGKVSLPPPAPFDPKGKMRSDYFSSMIMAPPKLASFGAAARAIRESAPTETALPPAPVTPMEEASPVTPPAQVQETTEDPWAEEAPLIVPPPIPEAAPAPAPVAVTPPPLEPAAPPPVSAAPVEEPPKIVPPPIPEAAPAPAPVAVTPPPLEPIAPPPVNAAPVEQPPKIMPPPIPEAAPAPAPVAVTPPPLEPVAPPPVSAAPVEEPPKIVPPPIPPQLPAKPVVRQTELPPIPGTPPPSLAKATIAAPEPASSPLPPARAETESVVPARAPSAAEAPPRTPLMAPAPRMLEEREFAPTGERPTIGGPRSTRVIPALSELRPSQLDAEGNAIKEPTKLSTPAGERPTIGGPRSTRVIPALADLRPGAAAPESAHAVSQPMTPITLATEGDAAPGALGGRTTHRIGPRAISMEHGIHGRPEPGDQESTAAGSNSENQIDLPIPAAAAAAHLRPIRTEPGPIPLKKSGVTHRIELPAPPEPKAAKPLRMDTEKPTAVRSLKDSGPILVPESKAELSKRAMPAPVPPPLPVPRQTERVPEPALAGQPSGATPPPIPESAPRPKAGPIRPGPIDKRAG